MSGSAQFQIFDRALVELMADGDKDALKLLYLRHRERVYRPLEALCHMGSQIVS
jgi:hypothetical protein